MEVKLLAYTPGPEGIVAAAARGCYSTKPASQLLDTKIPKAHGSCFEHITFTFSVEGVSRVLTHQLVRHRVGTAFSQQSQRYVDVKKTWENIVMPPSVQEVIDEYEALYDEATLQGVLLEKTPENYLLHNYKFFKAYLESFIDAMDNAGIPSEDIRYFIPQGTMSNITVTMNARELQHFCGLRRCTRAQWEIRELADYMAKLVEEECPELCEHLNLGSQCVQLTYCPEHKSCGRFPSISEIRGYAIKGKLIDFKLEIKVPEKKGGGGKE